MIKHNIEIPQTKFYTLLVVYRIHLTDNEMYKVYNIFKDVFQYNTTFTYIDEDTELLKFSINCKYVIQQICYELGIL